MSDKAMQPRGEIMVVPIEKVIPNDYNPNQMSEWMGSKLQEGLRIHGQYVPIVVRAHPVKEDTYLIVDGEQRYTQLKLGGAKEVWVNNLGDITHEEAIQITIEANETRGSYDPVAMGQALERLRAGRPSDSTGLRPIPFSTSKIRDLTDMAARLAADRERTRTHAPRTPQRLSDEVEDVEDEEEDRAAVLLRLGFSDPERFQYVVEKLNEVSRAAGLMSSEEGDYVAAVNLGDVVWAILKKLKVEKCAEAVRGNVEAT